MNRRTPRVHAAFYKLRALFSEELIALLLVVFVFAMPAAAATRFENRGLYMESATPGATTNYVVSLDYMSPEPVGSLDLLFCMSPIPYETCVPPAGLDVSNVTLSDQTGESGFSISQKTTNHIVLSRLPSMITSTGSASSYTFSNVKNPTNTEDAFSIRLKSHASTDASGPQIDFGSVRGQVTDAIVIETQVPPTLIFCVAQLVEEDCSSTDETYYTDMGELGEDSTLTAQSQMAVGTNATHGFAITVNGEPLTAGTTTIDGIQSPSSSIQGQNQFGINLVENDDMNVGMNPEGASLSAAPTGNYGIPNMFMYQPGDVIATSSNVSLMQKFTVSYIVNSSPNLKAGVYTTTINFIASGRF